VTSARFLVATVLASFALVACTSQPAPPVTGFLSDYSSLRPEGSDTLRWAPQARLRQYDRFIIDPVVVFLHPKADPSRIPPEKRDQLTTYMRGAVIEAIEGGYEVVTAPGPGVARVRIALTDITSSTQALNVLPPTRLTGLGLGGAALEAEVVDSLTGEQVSALVESRLAQRLNLPAGWTNTGDAEAVMRDWASRFRRTLDAAHGR
jgi:hypothetical protein